MNIELLPINKRFKELIKLHGKIWNVLEQRYVICFNDKGLRIKSLDNRHERWVRLEETKIAI